MIYSYHRVKTVFPHYILLSIHFSEHKSVRCIYFLVDIKSIWNEGLIYVRFIRLWTTLFLVFCCNFFGTRYTFRSPTNFVCSNFVWVRCHDVDSNATETVMIYLKYFIPKMKQLKQAKVKASTKLGCRHSE